MIGFVAGSESVISGSGEIGIEIEADNVVVTRTYYVEDLIADSRFQQPVGRGRVGIVTEIGWDPWPYDQWSATVAFGRDFSVGLVFSELSAVEIVAIPEPSSLVVLLLGVLLARAVLSRPGRAKANS